MNAPAAWVLTVEEELRKADVLSVDEVHQRVGGTRWDVRQALARLLLSGKIRRVASGLYQWVRA